MIIQWERTSANMYQDEIKDIIASIEETKRRLGDLSVKMDQEDLDAGALDEAMVSLDDAIDILTDELEEA